MHISQTTVEVLDLSCGYVGDTPVSLAQMGIAINSQVKKLSLTNVGNATVFVGIDTVTSVDPTAGVSKYARLDTGLTINARLNSLARLRLVCASGTTSFVNVQQEAD